MKSLLTLAAALSLSACATYSNGPIVDGGPVRDDGMAMLGQPTRVGSVVVTPLRVIEDSRCPINARCVWAGRLIVESRVDGSGWRETTNMELGRPYLFRNSVAVQLSAALPQRMAGGPPPGPYQFTYTGG